MAQESLFSVHFPEVPVQNPFHPDALRGLQRQPSIRNQGRECVHNLRVRKAKIEFPIVLQIPPGITRAIFLSQLLCNRFDQVYTIFSSVLTMLLFFHDLPANIPIGHHLRSADSLISACSSDPSGV